MKKYYKVIFIGSMRQGSLFAQTFGVRGLVDLPDGRRFYAQTTTAYDMDRKCEIASPVPLIHFCDNALDALLWRDIVFEQERYVFEVRPIGDVVKSVCNDKNGLYQCGAPGIELVKVIKEGELEQLAQREIADNPDAAIARYSRPCIRSRIHDLIQYGR